MWTRLVRWYDSWQEEQMAVLLDPSLAENVQGRLRRCAAKRLTKLSAIERSQLHAFCLKYQGRTLWMAALKLSILFSLFGVALYWWNPKSGLIVALLLAQLFGWMIFGALIGVWFNYRQLGARPTIMSLGFAIGICFGMLVGFSAMSWLYGRDPMQEFLEKGEILFKAIAICGLAYVALVGIVAIWRNKAYETITVQLALDAEREKNARQESESQLRMLRAQIEPHFLFNTLGAVQTLAEQGEQGAAKAAQLTANLIVFLRACMHEIRAERLSLREEFAMVRSYLEVMKVRMGQRLEFSLDLPDALASVKLPSMMLLSLAENAIKHGLEPAVTGGAVHISAHREGNLVRLCVLDTGVGLSEQPGTGIGLQNVRERLQLAFGAQSALNISELEHGGVMAEIVFPEAAAAAIPTSTNTVSSS